MPDIAIERDNIRAGLLSICILLLWRYLEDRREITEDVAIPFPSIRNVIPQEFGVVYKLVFV
jgi:hypothetical protein